MKTQHTDVLSASHTPTPWKISDVIDSSLAIYGADNKLACEVYAPVSVRERGIANAAYIVRATNHYQLMVDLLKEVYSDKGASGHVKGKIEEAFNSMGEVL